MLGRRYWIIIWYGILVIGVIGLLASLYWGRKTGWKNLDEILRAVGTVTVSLGMLMVLYRIGGGAEQTLLVTALFCFVLAFILGRKPGPSRPPRDEDDEDD